MKKIMEKKEVGIEDCSTKWIEECCNIVSWHSKIFKKEIEVTKDKEIKLNMDNISRLICSYKKINIKQSEEICARLKDIFRTKGIDAIVDEYYNGEKFLILREQNVAIDEPRIVVSIKGKENFNDYIKDNKIYIKDIKYLLCPKCHRYCVEFTADYYTKRKTWWCHNCLIDINYIDYDLGLSDKDKYQIYKLYGIDALKTFTNESTKQISKFVASYFKNSCMAKKDKCVYFNFFKEEENNKKRRLSDK
jgi:hypothetical protein